MAINIGKPSICSKDITDKVSELDILSYYLGITEIPVITQNPLRRDLHASLGFYTVNGDKILYMDFATKDAGDTFEFLKKYWGVEYTDVFSRIWNDIPDIKTGSRTISKKEKPRISTLSQNAATSALQCKIREWRDYDVEYWESYGVPLKWLKYADVYPISHKIVTKDGKRMVFPADKYAYAYVEHKEGKVSLKIYQPFNKNGFKWSNKHDKSVIGLWTKVPETGERICICSSMKDSLCLWANTGIPSLNVQGEGYIMSETAVTNLKGRYKKIFVLFDNDEPGLKGGLKLAEATGFINIVLPKVGGTKDISDMFKYLGDKEKFREILLSLFNQL